MAFPRVNGRFVFASLAACLFTLLFGSLVTLGALLHLPRAWIDRGCQLWGRWILSCASVRVRFEGLEHLPAGSAVLVGNHQGMFEIIALIAYLPRQPKFVAKAEVFRIPLFGQALRVLGHIAVERDNPDKAIASIRKGTAQLRARGDQVVFFPEGTRTRDGRLKPFKKGAFVFALESGLPLIPFAVEGSYQALPPKQKVIHPGLIRIRFLPQINTTPFNFETRDQLRDLASDKIARAVDQLRQTQPISEQLTGNS
ncbi:MAG: lysophospholipid acyltransferase family protein [Candidatus Sericytochromatia bacterium]